MMKEVGLVPVETSISTSSEVKEAAESLVGRVDVISVPEEDIEVSALESIITVANENKSRRLLEKAIQ